MTEKRLSPFKALRQLGPVFELRDISIAMGFDREGARQAAHRWAAGGYARMFCEGIYFNLVVDPNAADRHVVEAVERNLRRPKTLVGASALWAGGWTTQMLPGYEFAIAVDRVNNTWKRMEGVSAEGRPVEWFAAVRPYVRSVEGGFDVLSPAFALVDTIASAAALKALSKEDRSKAVKSGKTIWHPDPDDISLPVDLDPQEAWKDIEEAARVLRVDIDLVRSYAAGIPGMEDAVTPPALSGEAPRRP